MLYTVLAISVKRPSGDWEPVGGLRGASLSLDPETYGGAAVADGSGFHWSTSGAGPVDWSLSAESNASQSNGGVAAATAACRRGELLGIQISLGDGRQLSGEAYCEKAGRSGDAKSALALSLSFLGHGELLGLTEGVGEEYPETGSEFAIWDYSVLNLSDGAPISSVPDSSGNSRTLAVRDGTPLFAVDGGPGGSGCLVSNRASMIGFTGDNPGSTAAVIRVYQFDSLGPDGASKIVMTGNSSQSGNRCTVDHANSAIATFNCQRSQLGVGGLGASESDFTSFKVMTLYLNNTLTSFRINGATIETVSVGDRSFPGIVLGAPPGSGSGRYNWRSAIDVVLSAQSLGHIETWESYLMTRFGIS